MVKAPDLLYPRKKSKVILKYVHLDDIAGADDIFIASIASGGVVFDAVVDRDHGGESNALLNTVLVVNLGGLLVVVSKCCMLELSCLLDLISQSLPCIRFREQKATVVVNVRRRG